LKKTLPKSGSVFFWESIVNFKTVVPAKAGIHTETALSASPRAANPTELYFAVWARLLNELALWQIEPGDPAYERATLAVLKTNRAILTLTCAA
jgi:hypothetical protein